MFQVVCQNLSFDEIRHKKSDIHPFKYDGLLGVEPITRGVAWLDTGTPRALRDATDYIAAIEERQGLKVACLEEIAIRMGFLTKNEWLKTVEALPKSPYKEYLLKISDEFE